MTLGLWLVAVLAVAVAVLAFMDHDSSAEAVPPNLELRRIGRSRDLAQLRLEMRMDAARLKREFDAEACELERRYPR